jgi:hypothetical protein
MMNKKLNHLLALVMVLLCTAGMVTAQVTVNHPFSGNSGTFFTGPVTTINYYDNGGQFGSYSPNSSSGVVSFAPNAGGKIQAVFSIFQTESNFDALYCYDGPSTASPKIASANGVPIGVAHGEQVDSGLVLTARLLHPVTLLLVRYVPLRQTHLVV